MDFISDRVSCIKLNGRWCDIIVVNIHVQSEDKVHGIKDSFREEKERMFVSTPSVSHENPDR